MENNGLFHPNRHGYIYHHSTNTSLIQTYDNWLLGAEDGGACGVVMLDMSAAFDVPHYILE